MLFARLRQWFQTRRIARITYDHARERVARGAAYLDEIDPGWHRRVDANTLELADGQHCILGQLHGDFRLGLGRSHLLNMSSAPRPSLSPVAYGFQGMDGVPDVWQDRDYALLNRAWQAAVYRRQTADATPPADAPTFEGDGHGLPASFGDGAPGKTVPEVKVRERG